MTKPLGKNFARELARAGLSGLPISWSEDGSMTGYDSLTQQQQHALDVVIAAHDSTKSAVPQSLSRRQFFQALSLQGVLSSTEAEAAAWGQAIPDKLLVPLNALPTDQKDAARMHIRAATEFVRDHPLVALLAQAQSPPWTDQQVDDLWRFGATL